MVDRVAFVTGADRGLGLALTSRLLGEGWRVLAGCYMPDWPELDQLASHYPDRLTVAPLDVARADSAYEAAQVVAGVVDHVDVLINNAGVGSRTSDRNIRQAQDYQEMHRLYDVNALGPLRVVEALMPLLDRGVMKRLCFVSSEAGSINNAARTSWFGYCMSKAALNMAVRLLFNHLRPEGYTFRVYHPGWMRTYMSGERNVKADLEPEEAAVPALAYFLGDLADEGRLVLRDWRGREWPW